MLTPEWSHDRRSRTPPIPAGMSEIEVSVVMPCLNEARTVGACVRTARLAMEGEGVAGEVIICDNGSTDGSVEAAEREGARVVLEPRPGYGSAYMTGLAEARGSYIIIADSDGTYDLSKIPLFLALLKSGCEFVSGTRRGGGHIEGMPLLHRYLGNPGLTLLLKAVFGVRLSDVYCGMRGFTRDAYARISPLSPGMEFNLELVINAHKAELRCAEVPIDLRPRLVPSKLRTLRDGWRSLRFILLYAPKWLFLAPALACLGLAAAGFGVTLSPIAFAWADAWVQIQAVGSVLAILGTQILYFWLVSRIYSLSERFEGQRGFTGVLVRWFTLERGVLTGLAILLVGLAISCWLVTQWVRREFQPQHSRLGYLALTLMALGGQTMFWAFFLGLVTTRAERDASAERRLSK
jgi:hypothetical protein